MRIRLDPDLCQAHGTCCEEAPGVFGLDGETLRILVPEPPADRHDEVRMAVKYCPTRALSIEEE